jgi:hypothetical protein
MENYPLSIVNYPLKEWLKMSFCGERLAQITFV